jgi:hypothetical protein
MAYYSLLLLNKNRFEVVRFKLHTAPEKLSLGGGGGGGVYFFNTPTSN